MQTLVLIRHGESDGNNKGILAGQLNVQLTNTGREQAKKAGQNINTLGIKFDVAYSSQLQRALETLEILANQLDEPISTVIEHPALNERDFGNYTGIIKTSLQNKLGDVAYQRVIKGWNTVALNGESLRDVQKRVLPYFKAEIMSDLVAGKNIIVSSHHQTLRALIKYIENISNSEISKLSIQNAEPIIYTYGLTERLLIPEYYDFPLAN